MGLLLILLGFLPGLVWLIFFLQEDVHPEPKRMIAYTFIVGGLISIPTLASQYLLQNVMEFFLLDSVLFLFLGLAVIEETFKFLAVYLTVRWSPEFNEPMDALIYLVTAALGFATVENVAILADIINEPIAELWANSLSTASLRFIGATLLHALASAIVGYYWARGIIKKKVGGYVAYGLLLAVVFHYIFNLLILRFQNGSLVYPSIFLIILAFFVFYDFEKIKSLGGSSGNK